MRLVDRGNSDSLLHLTVRPRCRFTVAANRDVSKTQNQRRGCIHSKRNQRRLVQQRQRNGPRNHNSPNDMPTK